MNGHLKGDVSYREIRVALPAHLRTLAQLPRATIEVRLSVPVQAAEGSRPPVVTMASVLDSLEELYPALRGTIRGHNRGERRAHLRYFADGSDISFAPVDSPLPDSIVSGDEPFIVIGAISGG